MSPLDREEQDTIKLSIEVKDISKLSVHDLCPQGSNNQVNTDKTEVNVVVLDVDDNPPVFIQETLSRGFLSVTKSNTLLFSITV